MHDVISVRLRPMRLNDAPPYHALSYMWGDANITKQILANRRPFGVTENVWDFLSQTRVNNYTGFL